MQRRIWRPCLLGIEPRSPLTPSHHTQHIPDRYSEVGFSEITLVAGIRLFAQPPGKWAGSLAGEAAQIDLDQRLRDPTENCYR